MKQIIFVILHLLLSIPTQVAYTKELIKIAQMNNYSFHLQYFVPFFFC